MQHSGKRWSDLRVDKAVGRRTPTNAHCQTCCGLLAFSNGEVTDKNSLIRNITAAIAGESVEPPKKQLKAGPSQSKGATQPYADFHGTAQEWVAMHAADVITMYTDGYYCKPCARTMSSCNLVGALLALVGACVCSCVCACVCVCVCVCACVSFSLF